VGVAFAIAAVTFVVDPDLWMRWAGFMIDNAETPSPIAAIGFGPLRFAAAIALIAWGARTNRPWTVPIACGIASFALYEWSFLTIWLASLAMFTRSLPTARAMDLARGISRGRYGTGTRARVPPHGSVHSGTEQA
jgi:hypothetical protein